MRSFEDCIDFIENKLGIQLFDCQKEIIRRIYENPNLYIALPRLHGRYQDLQVLMLFYELMTKEDNNDT